MTGEFPKHDTHPPHAAVAGVEFAGLSPLRESFAKRLLTRVTGAPRAANRCQTQGAAMLKAIIQEIIARTTRRKLREQRDAIEGWTVFFGREAAQLWVQAQSERNIARPSNA